MGNYILALDQGTTSSRAIVFDRAGGIAGQAQHPFEQIYPQAGWVEHDPMEIWDSERRAAAEAIAAIPAGEIAGIGVTNQRETTILWDHAAPASRSITPSSGSAGAPAGAVRDAQAARGSTNWIESIDGSADRTRISPGTKIRWILRPRPRCARARRARGAAVRNGRAVADLAAHRRQSPRHGLLQRLAHDALRHPPALLGRASCCGVLGVPACRSCRARCQTARSTAA